jgi:hypothetical protein
MDNQTSCDNKSSQLICYDNNYLACFTAKEAVIKTPTPETLSGLFNAGHMYVYDSYFLDNVCHLPSDVCWRLFDMCPYIRYAQFDYASALAIDTYVQGVLSGEHNKSILDATDEIILYAQSLAPYASIEIEDETRQELKQILSTNKYYLSELIPGLNLFRVEGDIIRTAWLGDNNTILFDPDTKLTLSDLGQTWERVPDF